MFIYKLFSLIKHLVNIHSKPRLKILSIELGNSVDNTIIKFMDTQTNKQSSLNVKDLQSNLELVKLFDGVDAGQIGYTYGRFNARKNCK